MCSRCPSVCDRACLGKMRGLRKSFRPKIALFFTKKFSTVKMYKGPVPAQGVSVGFVRGEAEKS